MLIDKKTDGNRMTVALNGRLDSVTSLELDEALEDGFEGIEDFVFDFTDLEYISSAGLRILLKVQRAMNAVNGKMKVIGVNDTIRQILDVTGFLDIITVE
ncbi:MAG: STAS domain-containing protein [Erysipelotrichaceae bacterium]|nr:STAS domain-containing protein [Erysipelotrichaceae bacterium]